MRGAWGERGFPPFRAERHHAKLVAPGGQFADMALDEATDFWRADPYDGGITGVMKVAHSAEGYGMDVELHIAGPAQRHCMAAMRNSNFY